VNVTLIRSLDSLPPNLQGGAVTIGNFDGVHLGHARLIERLEGRAAELGGPAIVFTFEPHPVVLLRPEAAPPPLTWAERKAELLKDLGVDTVIAYPTDEPLLRLTPEEFFERIVCERLQAKAVVEGPNFRFGRDRRGDVSLLADLCRRAGIALEIVEPVKAGEGYISSSRVRECIRKGDVDGARSMLTRPYRVRGFVTHGARRGATIGFPTANIEAVDTLLPGIGVYAGQAHSTSGTWPAAINIGPNPTFSEHALKFETHLIGYSGSLYGQPLEVDFLARLRDIQPFGSVEKLKQQLGADIQEATRIAADANLV
jgi:riboflavin kinase/FMN adenylyltransferase